MKQEKQLLKNIVFRVSFCLFRPHEVEKQMHVHFSLKKMKQEKHLLKKYCFPCFILFVSSTWGRKTNTWTFLAFFDFLSCKWNKKNESLTGFVFLLTVCYTCATKKEKGLNNPFCFFLLENVKRKTITRKCISFSLFKSWVRKTNVWKSHFSFVCFSCLLNEKEKRMQ